MMPKFGLYAYAVVGKNIKQLNILGIDKENKVYPVERKGLTVLVSKIDTGKFRDQVKEALSQLTKTEKPISSKVEEILRAHQQVIDELAGLATIVPFKFGTILKDEEAATKMLLDYGEKFKRLLSKFFGREEWGLKIYVDNQKFKDYLVKNEPKFKQQEKTKRKLSRGAAYLLGKKMETELNDQVGQRLNEIAQVILRETEKIAYEVQLNKTLPQKLTGKDKQMLLNTAYLIGKEKIIHFNNQIKRLKEKYEPAGLDLEVSGPWPAYSFI